MRSAVRLQTLDGEFQTLSANDGTFNRAHFFSKTPELRALVAHLSDAQIDQLRRGGHDPVKIHAAFAEAAGCKGRPTVVLAMTMKGYGMGTIAQGRMTTHQQKKLSQADLMAFRDRFSLPLSDQQVMDAAFYRPPEDSPEMQYLQARRAELGGYLPVRSASAATLAVPGLEATAAFALHADGKAMSSTMAWCGMLGALLKDPVLGPRIVPIVADEARTFGMAGLFKQVGIYAPFGQLYQPEDSASMLSYRETRDGQILEEDQRGRCAVVVDGGGHQLTAWPADAAVLYLLQHVRLPARGRPDLGRGRPARPRLPGGRHVGTHHARWRRAAASGRQQPSCCGHDPELPRL
jgi:pyruvate dehydrogenase E1 component